jgi:predicted nucleic acid-binding Zn ribbon protein
VGGAELILILILVLVVAWIVGCVRGYRKAVANGYSEWQAGCGALLLGPFSFLLAFAKPRGKKCQFCQSIIDEKATVCPKCTREQKPPVLASAVPSAPQTAPNPVAPLTPGRTCPKCGQSLSEDATVCDKCGVILAKARSDQPRKV